MPAMAPAAAQRGTPQPWHLMLTAADGPQDAEDGHAVSGPDPCGAAGSIEFEGGGDDGYAGDGEGASTQPGSSVYDFAPAAGPAAKGAAAAAAAREVEHAAHAWHENSAARMPHRLDKHRPQFAHPTKPVSQLVQEAITRDGPMGQSFEVSPALLARMDVLYDSIDSTFKVPGKF